MVTYELGIAVLQFLERLPSTFKASQFYYSNLRSRQLQSNCLSILSFFSFLSFFLSSHIFFCTIRTKAIISLTIIILMMRYDGDIKLESLLEITQLFSWLWVSVFRASTIKRKISRNEFQLDSETSAQSEFCRQVSWLIWQRCSANWILSDCSRQIKAIKR